MRDYAEILKSMRICLNVDRDSNCLSECFGCNYIVHDDHVMDMVRDAADAIEELLAEVKHLELEAAANETDKQYLAEENRKLVDSLMNFIAPKWIGVEERLPEKGEMVLCYDKRLGLYVLESGESGYPDFWMPLPAPPEEVLLNGEV